MVPTATVISTPKRAFSRPIAPLPLIRISDVLAGPVAFRASMCGCGTCSKITATCEPGRPALEAEAAVSVIEAGYTALDRHSGRRATRTRPACSQVGCPAGLPTISGDTAVASTPPTSDDLPSTMGSAVCRTGWVIGRDPHPEPIPSGWVALRRRGSVTRTVRHVTTSLCARSLDQPTCRKALTAACWGGPGYRTGAPRLGAGRRNRHRGSGRGQGVDPPEEVVGQLFQLRL
jgi:hypothetical protein